MKPAAFEYVRPRSLDEALLLLARGDAEMKILAGGQSLVPMLNMRLVRPSTLVDINGLAGLDGIRETGDGGLALGALVRHADLAGSFLVRARAPLLATAAAHVGHRAIRNRGTLGGSLAHADPAAELPAAAVALDATLVATGPAGVRRLPASDFFVGLFATALAADEILTEVHVPDLRGTGWGFAEVARRAGDFALAGVAVVLRAAPGAPGRCDVARLVAFGAGPNPMRLGAAEALLAGRAFDANRAGAVGTAAAGACAPDDDLHASAEYRRHLVSILTEQAIREALERLAAGRES